MVFQILVIHSRVRKRGLLECSLEIVFEQAVTLITNNNHIITFITVLYASISLTSLYIDKRISAQHLHFPS